MKNFNVINNYGIYGNEINMYDQSYNSNGEHKKI